MPTETKMPMCDPSNDPAGNPPNTRYIVCRNTNQGRGESTIVALAPGSIVDGYVAARDCAEMLRRDGKVEPCNAD